ncbi:Nif3-like dinuclear metal center hexameric protein [Haloarculaceae archaeon H-GB2-1]|nr:Nif3-like dinuclear metal center hexameric protein [Haloarculaceae archaeon H-GB1-1]MEA5386735.1 Nif3-like dinuclear metal center hexameric protein [Haloarculaceae archaeon H-GB11]MEA5408262.1 Nif3-like dinuclear metal center hexameric protein [Haloarculaceae archaeon H-GB2-1]
MELATLCERLDDRLATAEFADVDASANGLQVGPDEASIDSVAFAVDAAAETIAEAADAGADLLVVHHGLSWGGFDRVTSRTYDRIAPLVENDVALYVSHLPLDGHQELGNAAGVADLLDLDDREPFGSMGPVHIGQAGRASEAFGRTELRETLTTQLDTGGEDVQVLDFGPERIEDVAIVTGSGVDWLDEAVEWGADALVTGEGKQKAYHEAREAGINVFLAGHYATETFGVRALESLVSEWDVETTYLDVPTGL